MSEALFINKTYGTVAFGTTQEMIGAEYWAQVPLDEVYVIQEIAAFGNAKLLYRILAGNVEVLPESNTMGTTVSRDFLQRIEKPIPPGTRLNMIVRNTDTATAFAPTLWLRAVRFKLDELRG